MPCPARAAERGGEEPADSLPAPAASRSLLRLLARSPVTSLPVLCVRDARFQRSFVACVSHQLPASAWMVTASACRAQGGGGEGAGAERALAGSRCRRLCRVSAFLQPSRALD